MQPHIDTVDPYGPAAAAGLHVGDMIINVNGQSYKHAAQSKVRAAIRAAEGSGQLSLSLYRDFGTPRASAPTQRGFDSTPRRAVERPRAAEAEHLNTLRRHVSLPVTNRGVTPSRSPFSPTG
jgi:C-terminal processing protease CtpA/Prc